MRDRSAKKSCQINHVTHVTHTKSLSAKAPKTLALKRGFQRLKSVFLVTKGRFTIRTVFCIPIISQSRHRGIWSPAGNKKVVCCKSQKVAENTSNSVGRAFYYICMHFISITFNTNCCALQTHASLVLLHLELKDKHQKL